MDKNKVVEVLGYMIAFLLGALLASYQPLPGITLFEEQKKECPAGFATLEEMRFLVDELRICKEVNK